MVLIFPIWCYSQCHVETVTEGNYSGTGRICKKKIKNSYGTKYEANLRDGEWVFLNVDGVKYKKGNYLIEGELSVKSGIWTFFNESGTEVVKLEYKDNKPERILAVDSGMACAGPDSVRVYSPDSGVHWEVVFAENGLLKKWTLEDLGKWVPFNPTVKEKKEYKPIIGVVGLQDTDADASDKPKTVKENVFWTDEEMLEMFPQLEPLELDSQAQSATNPNLFKNPQFLQHNKSLKDGTYVLSPKVVDDWSPGMESPDVFVRDGQTTLGFRAAGQNYELVKTSLETPLTAGKVYCFSVQVRLKEKRIYALNRIGAWFVEKEQKNPVRAKMGQDGQLVISPDDVPICFRDSWLTIQGRFVATGNEKYVYFGHFSDESSIQFWPLDSIYTAPAMAGEIYYEMRKPILTELNTGESCPCTINDCPEEEVIVLPQIDSFVLTSVQFETGKWQLLEISFEALDSLADYLIGNETYQLEIIGHTDDQGKPESNQVLSEKRAKEVMKYLHEKGVDKQRMSAIGKGAAEPIDDNSYDEGREKNRRVEFRVIKS